MTLESPIIVLDSPRCELDAALAGRELIEQDLNVAGQCLRVRLAVADVPLRLAQVVPLAQSLSDSLCQAARHQARLQGQGVSCRKGCSSCCHYLVPVSVPEAFALWEDINALDAGSRDRVVQSFVQAARRVLAAEPPRIPELTDQPGGQTVSPAGAVGQWYARLDLPCPLLQTGQEAGTGMCRVYARRPLACREHMVNSPADLCRGFQPGRGQIHRPGFSVLEALGQLAAELEDTGVEAIVMTLAPAWALSNLDRAARTWRAAYVVRRLLAICRELADRASQSDEQPTRAAA